MSPVFDVSREALILTIENGVVAARSMENIETPTPALKPDRLVELGVETLICGAISEPLNHELTARGMRVIGFVAGEIEDVLKSYLAGTLPTPALSMPGCCGRRRQFHGSRGKRGRRGSGKRQGRP
jgi:predicted Fe-Mo cluster-binding NifX family protein